MLDRARSGVEKGVRAGQEKLRAASRERPATTSGTSYTDGTSTTTDPSAGHGASE